MDNSLEAIVARTVDNMKGARERFHQLYMPPKELDELRKLDAEIAEKFYGMATKTITVDWYPLPITLFYAPWDDGLITYSLDANACNACMRKNGKDGDYASPLPHYSDDIEHAWPLLLGYFYVINKPSEDRVEIKLFDKDTMIRVAKVEAETEEQAICLAVLQAKDGKGV